MHPAAAALLRQIPSVDELLRHPQLAALLEGGPRPWAVKAIRRHLAGKRQEILALPAEALPTHLPVEALVAELAQVLAEAARPSLRRVVNATGVIIHTNLGRSPLAQPALAQLEETAAHYCTLEYDLAAGKRGSRQAHLEGLLTELTSAEAALIVNNNAAAVLLALMTMARGREVVISRGQLVEIGGSFRMPDVMALSGAILREVGTTNKTYLRDYESAITSQTAMLLKVHPSNYRITGFTHETPLADLVALGRRYGLAIMEDLGSGCLLDLSRYGLEREPTVQEAVATGADLVTFSGDKLLGGPQAGLILGKQEAVKLLKGNPLLRALRPDKMTLAGLEATLRLYQAEPQAVAHIPTLRLLTKPLSEVRRDARRLARLIKRRGGARYQVEIKPSLARLGGGALPEAPIPSCALALSLPPLSPHQLELRLRRAKIPVIARLEHEQLLLDVRTLLPQDFPALLTTLTEIEGTLLKY